MVRYLFILLTLSCFACTPAEQEHVHGAPTHNFTVHRLLIINDQNEMLMMREQHVWAPPSHLFDQRQYIREGLDSLAAAYGVTISTPQLRGQFSFKYDYHPYATIRNYYVARYESGTLQIPPGEDEAQWVPVPEAIARNSVTAIKQICDQIVSNPDAVWGGSFMVSHVGDDHPTEMVGGFYPL
ncbi:MAG: hypothetical protein AAF840_08960 [Bacteroidota bacterium]